MSHHLYGELAPWWPLLSTRDSYAEEAAHILGLIDEALGRPAHRILELGSGGGLLASHFGNDREVVLTDRSSDMLAVAHQHNPQRTTIEGDMRTLRLGTHFDAVLLHDAVMYLTDVEDLFAAFQTAAAHLEAGGVFMVLPDVVKENFKEQTLSGGSIGKPAAQLLEWHWDADPEDDTFQVEMSFLLKDEAGTIQAVHERHDMGLYSAQTYVNTLRRADFEMVEGLIWDEHQLPEVFCGRRIG
jgi:SAM-dependent methyltransferase